MGNYIKATNFRIKDSLVTGDPNKRIKGTEIDDEFVALATAISSKADSASPTFTGTPTAPTASAGDNSSKLATTAFVFQNSVPVGAILMWSGLISAIPSGYALCDGTAGTPNLTDRFVIGAGSTYSVGATGGNKDLVVPAHTHTTTITDAGHTHTDSLYNASDNGVAYSVGGSGNPSFPTGGTNSVNTSTTGISVSVNTTGVSATDKNLPPYYALAFIQRVS